MNGILSAAMLKKELELVKAELQLIKDNQLSGDQKVQLSGNKVTKIAEVTGLEIPAGTSTKVFSLVDLSKYAYFWIAVYPSAYKSFESYVQWMIGAGNAYTNQIPLLSGTTRDISEWYEVKALLADVFVKNTASTTETYTRIALFGVG